MYTELVLNVSLRDLPKDVEETLDAMMACELPKVCPDHPLFKTDRASYMLRTASHYFIPESTSAFIKLEYTSSKYLSVRTDLKNYGSEIELFCDWLAPYADDGFAGYQRYEESDDPTLLYFENGKVIRRSVGEVVQS